MPRSLLLLLGFTNHPIILFDSQTCPPFFCLVIAVGTICSGRDEAARASPAQQKPSPSTPNPVHARGWTSAPEAKPLPPAPVPHGRFTSGGKIPHICARLTLTRTWHLQLCFLSAASLLPPGWRQGSVGMLLPEQGMPRCRLAQLSPPGLLRGPSPSQGDLAGEVLGGSLTSLVLSTEAVESPN